MVQNKYIVTNTYSVLPRMITVFIVVVVAVVSLSCGVVPTFIVSTARLPLLLVYMYRCK